MCTLVEWRNTTSARGGRKRWSKKRKIKGIGGKRASEPRTRGRSLIGTMANASAAE